MASNTLVVALAVLMAAGQTVAAQRGRATRFQGMDRNNDGRITRAEWNGSDWSFNVNDWTGDGVLSGDEVRPGARRAGRQDSVRDDDTPDREYEFDDWTARGFSGLDHNRDNRITADEWHFDREGFARADHNRDGVLSRSEFLHENVQQQDDDRPNRFAALDLNRDNAISRDEWHGSRAGFDLLDDNEDGVLTRPEVLGPEPAPDPFTRMDANRNGTITRDEWSGPMGGFNRLDKNRDRGLTREEFSGTVPVATSGNPTSGNRAYQAGRNRGLTEGRAAGREDRERNQGWDLAGQRELEQADSGYDVGMGARADYQKGYREAFEVGYREGFGSR